MLSGSKRLRVMAGPNGSGKSTILQEVRKQFFSGQYVNADDIERQLHAERKIDLLNSFGISAGEDQFQQFVQNEGASWIHKAKERAEVVNVQCSDGFLITGPSPSPYDAALSADFIRFQLLEKNETFTFETVLSHSSKIDFLRRSNLQGFKNYLYFICMIDPQINIERVSLRVKLGGHSVPEDRIKKRYYESLELLQDIIPLCYRVYLFDNSTEERTIDPVVEIDDKHALVIRTENLPWWVEEYVIKKLYR
ncbi:MAG: hypothetical protein QM664_09870 [Flavihumibacter sp.]